MNGKQEDRRKSLTVLRHDHFISPEFPLDPFSLLSEAQPELWICSIVNEDKSSCNHVTYEVTVDIMISDDAMVNCRVILVAIRCAQPLYS